MLNHTLMAKSFDDISCREDRVSSLDVDLWGHGYNELYSVRQGKERKREQWQWGYTGYRIDVTYFVIDRLL
jgi:hypothetical protein